MPDLDPRIVRVGIEVDGAIKYYEGLNISIQGMKYGNENQNECNVNITNLQKETRDYILSETSPFNKNKKPKKLIVEAGRVSYGTTQIFIGDITNATVSQPPDIVLGIKAMTGNYAKGDVIARSQPAQTPLRRVAEQVATDLGVSLNYQASDKNIANYSFTGGALKQVEKLQSAGNVNAYLDDGVLVVKNWNEPLTGKKRILNIDTGMIGIPETTEQGIKVKFLLDNQTVLGGGLEIQSKMYPAINGEYVIFKLGFEIASRDVPFYWVAEAKRRN